MARRESVWHHASAGQTPGPPACAANARQGDPPIQPALVLRLLMLVTPIRARSATSPIIDVRLQTSEVLKSYPGHAFCDECLAGKVGYPTREVRRARIGLAGSSEFEQEMTFCSVCLEQKHVIHVAWLRFDVAATPQEEALDS
jgi:hypothetical protein